MSRVYVGNLDPRVSERELEDEFRVFGVIRRPAMHRGSCSGFFFVNLVVNSINAAQERMVKTNGRVLFIYNMRGQDASMGQALFGDPNSTYPVKRESKVGSCQCVQVNVVRPIAAKEFIWNHEKMRDRQQDFGRGVVRLSQGVTHDDGAPQLLESSFSLYIDWLNMFIGCGLLSFSKPNVGATYGEDGHKPGSSSNGVKNENQVEDANPPLRTNSGLLKAIKACCCYLSSFEACPSVDADAFAKQVREIHVNDGQGFTVVVYKAHADVRRWFAKLVNSKKEAVTIESGLNGILKVLFGSRHNHVVAGAKIHYPPSPLPLPRTASDLLLYSPLNKL
ncbi:hypothetical protein RJ640_005878 [Escallonia rubra]|uniref:RRM domain-containing protein n=1 Tax=Escallonia rubra TaxID=112253 RepID=A0AA88UTM5_9ASTE|nr:hypothetical protein RJ640_005878 [Escallonia rubra]